MATILAYTPPAIGHLFPMMPLLLELQSRGHAVHVRTLAKHVELLQSMGLIAEMIDPRIEQIEIDDYTGKGIVENLRLSSATFTRRGELDGPDFRKAVEATHPDVVIVDLLTWGASAAAEALGIPCVGFDAFAPVINSRGTPPFGPGLAPMTGRLGAARDAVVRRVVMGMIEKTQLPPVNRLRQQHGLGPVSSVDELFRKAPLILVTTAKPFEYAVTDWGPDVVMIGACPWEPPAQAPDWLRAIDEPILLATTSSEFQDDSILVRTALEAFANEPVHVVATVPAGSATNFNVPSNATVVEFVSHSRVLERAAVAITHGGAGATQKALAHGVPVCVVPFGRDQFEIARRVEVSKSGTRLPAKKLSPDRLRAAVTKAMTMTPGAKQVAAGYIATCGASAGADAIEQRFLHSHTATSRPVQLAPPVAPLSNQA